MTLTYRAGRLLGRFIFFCCVRTHVLDEHFAQREGGYVLALTHLSHLEPIAAGVLLDRPIEWMTRKEFYRYHVFRALLNAMNAFKVDRQGISVSAVRTAIEVIVQSPGTWPVFTKRSRAYRLRRFPYRLVYALLPETDEILIATVMHTSRDSDYVADRLGDFPQSETP